MNLTLSKSSRARETSRELVLKIDHSKDNLHQNHHPVLKNARSKDDLQSNKGQTGKHPYRKER